MPTIDAESQLRGMLIPLHMHVLIVAASVAMYGCVNQISSIVFPHLSLTYRKLSKKDRIEWDSRVASNLNTLVAVLGLFPTIFAKTYKLDPITGQTEASEQWMLVVIGYFIYDLLLVIRHWEQIGTKTILIHHITVVAAAYAFLLLHTGVYFYAFMSGTEASTPFVNQRWFLKVCNMRDSKQYYINGLLLWFSFGVIRVGAIFFILYKIWKWFDLFMQVSWFCNGLMLFGFLSLSILNVYWFYLITRGIVKVLTSSGQEKSKA